MPHLSIHFPLLPPWYLRLQVITKNQAVYKGYIGNSLFLLNIMRLHNIIIVTVC